MRSPWLSEFQRSNQSELDPEVGPDENGVAILGTDKVVEKRRRVVGPLFAVDRGRGRAHLTLFRCEKPGGELQKRGLARAVGADDTRPALVKTAGELLDERRGHARIGKRNVMEVNARARHVDAPFVSLYDTPRLRL